MQNISICFMSSDISICFVSSTHSLVARSECLYIERIEFSTQYLIVNSILLDTIIIIIR